jgi:TonB-dependent receptor
MQRIVVLALAAGLAGAPYAPLHAQGVVTGTVVEDATGLPITGAVIRIEALSRGVVSDRTGRFTFASVPAGSHTLTSRYLGFTPLSQSVDVRDAQVSTVALRLKPATTRLGTVAVVASRTGQAAALSQQQAAANVSNVVAADQIGRFPDANIGDALKRIPGITVALDQGEARFGSIRGTEPRFNSVMINGERVPSAEAEVREVQLDLVPADMVQALEVNKTLTPDMDADAIGGSINVITRAAPSSGRLSATAGSGYNFIREKPVLIGNVVGGQRFLADRLGVIVSASYYDQRYGSDNKEGTWDQTSTGQAYMDEFDIRRYDIQRVRRSMSGSFDYRLGEASTITLRSIYNARDDWENRFRARFVLGAPNAQGIQTAEIRRQTKGGGPGDRVKEARLEDQRMWSHQLGGEHLLGQRVTLSWSGALSRASERRPDERYIEWRARNVAIQPNYTDQQNPTFTAITAAQVADNAFTFRRIEQLEGFTKDEDRNARVDLTLPFREGAKATRAKVGFRYRGKEKLRDNSYNFAVPTTAFTNMAALGARNFDVDKNLAGPYRYGSFTAPGTLAGLNLFNSATFRLDDQPGEYAAGNFGADETILGGYAMLEQQLTSKVSFIAGLRFERTDVEYRGFEYNIDNDNVTPTLGAQDYGNVLPSINLRWEAPNNTVFRAAATRSVARPNYFDLVPYREISLDDNELATGNPDLKPTLATNLDLMVERYFASVGLVSAGVFHKRITDFIFNYTQLQATDPVTGRTFSQISQPRNGAEATLTGVELALQRQLDFLPGVLRYLGVYTNYTYNKSEATGVNVSGRERETLPLLGTPEHSGNLSLSFDAPRVNLRAAFNYQSESLDPGEGGYNDDAFFDRWADRRTDIDVNGSVQLTQNARWFIEVNNLNDRPLRYYQGVRGRLMQDEFYGRRIQSGLKFDF